MGQTHIISLIIKHLSHKNHLRNNKETVNRLLSILKNIIKIYMEKEQSLLTASKYLKNNNNMQELVSVLMLGFFVI